MSKILISVMKDLAASEKQGEFVAVDFVGKHGYDCRTYARAFQDYGDDVFFADWQSWNGETFTEIWHENKKCYLTSPSLYDLNCIWLYKTPNYFAKINDFLQMLLILEKQAKCLVNNPNTIRFNLNKEYLWTLEKNGIRIVPTYPVISSVMANISPTNPMVVKPKYGAFAHGVRKITTIADMNIITGKEDGYLLQEYQATVQQGEISLVFLGLNYQHAIKRTPPQDSIYCNIQSGASVIEYHPTTDEIEFAQEVLNVHNNLGYPVHISRIDMFKTAKGLMLSEAEVFNPTLLTSCIKESGFSKAMVDYFHREIIV